MKKTLNFVNSSARPQGKRVRETVLRAGEVHLWMSNLDATSEVIEHLLRLLSEEEGQRFSEFRNQTKRRRACVGRGTLRIILSYYLGCEPEKVEIGYGEDDRPFLKSREGIGLDFNVSHSRERLSIAITVDAAIGIDVECVRPATAMHRVADHYFTAHEARELKTVSGELQLRRYYHFWTRREAYGKAIGIGLNALIHVFGDEVRGHSTAILHSRLQVTNEQEELTTWWFLDIGDDELEGSIAVSRPPDKCRAFQVHTCPDGPDWFSPIEWPAGVSA